MEGYDVHACARVLCSLGKALDKALDKDHNGVESNKRQPVSADGRARGGISTGEWRLEMVMETKMKMGDEIGR